MTQLTTQQEQTLEVYERFDDIAYGGGDLSELDDVVTEDFSHHAPFPTPQGRDGYRQFLGGFRQAFPDHTSTTEDTVVQGNKIAVRYTARGTQEGEFMGIPATGNQIEIQGISIYEIVDGKVAAEWAAPDIIGMMQQLGAAPGPDDG